MTRTIPYDNIREAAYQLCLETLFHLRDDIYAALERALAQEEEPAHHYLELLLENADIASKGRLPLVSNPGLPEFFVEMGHEVQVEGGSLTDALREGLQTFIQNHPFRIPVLEEPLESDRIKTDALPLLLHLQPTEGDQFRIQCLRISADSERVSRVAVFSAQDISSALEDFVLKTVLDSRLRVAPPFLVGVGLGGTMAEASLQAKQALLRPIGKPPPSLSSARLEQEVMETINQLQLGPGGLGGLTTALAVHIASSAASPEAIPLAVRLSGSTSCSSEVLL